MAVDVFGNPGDYLTVAAKHSIRWCLLATLRRSLKLRKNSPHPVVTPRT